MIQCYFKDFMLDFFMPFGILQNFLEKNII